MALLIALSLVAGSALRAKTMVPSMGRVAGIEIGETTVQEFEKRHGKGFSDYWGLGAGRRHYWYDATTGAEICLDGTFAKSDGQVIDDIEITWRGKGRIRVEREFDASGPHPAYKVSLPVIHLCSDELGVLAFLHPGQTRKQVESITGKRLDKYDMIRSPGNIDYGHVLRYIADGDPWQVRGFYLWIAGCSFEHGRMNSISFSAAGFS